MLPLICDGLLESMNRNTIIAMVSNFSTAYNLIVINVAHVIIAQQFCADTDSSVCVNGVDFATTACLVGAIVGQLTFGYVGDCLGRSAALRLTMALSIFGALISAVAVPLPGANPESILYFLGTARFVLGVGVGGVYPLSATVASESSDAGKKGAAVALVFSMQGVGALVVPLVAWVFLGAFGQPRSGCGSAEIGWAWRLTLGIGASSARRRSPSDPPASSDVPPFFCSSLSLALRDDNRGGGGGGVGVGGGAGALPGIILVPFKATETKRADPPPTTTSLLLNDDDERPVNASPLLGADEAADAPKPAPAASVEPLTMWQALGRREFWPKILGTAGGWFLFDITFYGNTLFQVKTSPSLLSLAQWNVACGLRGAW